MIDVYKILAPSEYAQLLKSAPNVHMEMKIKGMMHTGARYKELQSFGDNPQWFHPRDKVIKLPASATKTGKARNVYLTPAFTEELKIYLTSNELHYPDKANMGKSLKRWWAACQNIDIDNLEWWPMPKTFRKTWVSYLLAMEYPLMKVSQSMGHTVAVCEHHYANLDPCLITEKEAVKELTRGWMT